MIRAFPERSIYLEYQQIKTLQATARRGNLLVRTILALAVIFSKSLPIPSPLDRRAQSGFFLLHPSNGVQEDAPSPTPATEINPAGSEIHLLSLPRQRQQQWIPTSPASLREIY